MECLQCLVDLAKLMQFFIPWVLLIVKMVKCYVVIELT
jgi:hypothetical protein